MDVYAGGKYQHRLTGLPCTVTEYFGDRQRVNLRLENGRELQEVAFHDLLHLSNGAAAPVAEEKPPVPEPVPDKPEPDEEPEDIEDRDEDDEDDDQATLPAAQSAQ